MRRHVLAVPLCLLLAAGCTRSTMPTNVHETHTFPATAGKLVKLDLRSLDVKVKVVEASAVTVTVDLEARSSSRSAARRFITSNTPVFEDSPSTLEVRQPSHSHGIVIFGFMHSKGTVALNVPPSCRLEVRTSSGDVTIEGETALSGAVRINTSSGDVKVRGGIRELVVKTSSGDVRIDGPVLDVLQADTSSGDLSLESGSDRTLVETASGDVRLRKLAGDLSVDTASGDVEANWGRLADGHRVRVNTASGDVRLRLPEATALRGEISTASGRINSDFAGERERHEHRISFATPSGGVDLDVHTSSGDVTIRKGAQTPLELPPHH